jgi:metal-sulfur cluster biosynthetic enzyme
MVTVLVGASISLLVAATVGQETRTHFAWRQDQNRTLKNTATVEDIYGRLRGVMDPEIQVNIVDLGLVRSVIVDPSGATKVVVTPTMPQCPATKAIVEDIRKAVMADPGVSSLDLTLDLKTPWSWDRVSPQMRERIISGLGGTH